MNIGELVQFHSLTVVKEAIERIGAEPAISGGGLRQVSAAELLLRHLLPEMLAAERGSGAAVAETLQILLEKFQCHLTADQQLVLAGVAILERCASANRRRRGWTSCCARRRHWMQ